MKKIDMKKTLNERVRNTEWTEENTWNVLRKIRNAKSVRREFSLRRLMPAAVALVLVLGIGVAALTRTPGSPDPIRENEQYTAQPLVTALSAGQGEGTGDLPEGAAEAIYEQMKSNYPEIADQLRPVNLSCENDGIRLELISGVVKGNEAWVVYSLQDVEGRYSGSEISGYPGFSSVMGDVDSGESPLLYTDEKEHKQYFCAHEVYEQPVDPADRLVYFGMSHYEAERKVMLDLLDLLKEHGTTQEGVLSPELAPISTTEGEVPRNKMKVLDYTKPLDVPVLDDVKLTGVGWIDGSVHVQFHNPNAHGFGGERVSASGNWSTYLFYDWDYDTEDLYDWAFWDENGDGSIDWEERILNCTPELLEKLQPTVEVSVTDALVEGDWEIRFPLRMICADTTDQMDEYLELLEKNAEVCEVVEIFLRDWAMEDFSDMYLFTDDGWRTSVYMGENRLRTLAASGSVVNYLIDSVSGETGDAERTAVCTVKMLLPGEEEPVYRRYEIRLRKDQENGRYGVDPACLEHWEQGEELSGYPLPSISDIAFGDSVPYKGNKQMVPVNLSSEKQGIRMNVLYGIVNGQEAAIIYSLEDPEGRYAGFPDEPVLTHDIGSVSADNRAYLHRSEKDHKAYYMQYIDFDQPVTPEDRTVTLKMESVKVTEKDQADLTQMLKQYAKAADGVEPPQLAQAILGARYTGPTKVPDLKVLDYTKPLDLPLFGNVTLGNIGWIDGKLHVQLHTDSPNVGGFEKIWLNTSLDGNTDTLWKELDYSPLEWYGDNGSWYEFVYDYAPEDLEKLEMTLNAICEAKTLEDEWTVSFPLSTICAEDKPAAAETAELSQAEGENMRQYYARIKDEMHPVGLSLEKQGIRVEIESALVHGDESLIQYSIQDLEGKYKDLYMDLDGYDFINTICANDEQVYGLINRFNLGVSILNLGEDKNTHKHGFLRQTKHTEPVQPEDREVTLGLKDIRFMWRTVKELNEYLKEYAKTEEGVFDSYYIPTQETIKILGQENRLEIPLERDDVLLTGIGWIDGKLHVRVEYTGEKDPVKIAINDRVCQVGNNSIYSDTREPIRELDYSPVLFRDDSTGMVTGYEMVLDCSPEDVEKISLEVNIRVLEKVLEDDWTFQVPLSMICPEVEPAAEEPKAQTGELLNESYNIDGTEVQLHAVDRSFEKQGMRVNVIGGLVKGNEFWVKYSVQDLENKYSGLEMFPEAYINTVCPEDGMSTGEVVPERAVVITSSLDTDKVSHTSTFLTQFIHSQTIQDKGQEITFGLKDLKFTRHTTVDLHKYVEEYAKPEEGELSRTYNGQKILNTSEKLNIPMGRDDVLLTGIGWIDNKLHARFEYTDEGDFLKNGKSYGQACNVWISGEYLDSAKKQESGVAYTMLTGSDKAGATPNRFEEILECGPDNYNEVSLRAHIEVIEDAVQDDWAVSFPLNTIYEGNEPAETAAAETNEEWQDAIRGCVNEILTCWQQKDIDGLLAMCTEPWRSERTQLSQILGKRVPEIWQITDIEGEGWPAATVECEIRMQSESDAGFYFIKMKKEEDGLWYFEPTGLGDGTSVYSTSSTIRDEDVVLSVNETGSTVKAEEIPPFVSRINEFYTCWNKNDLDGMLALCPPDMRNVGYANFMNYLESMPGTPQEWKIGHLYGKPEDDIRGASCEAVHLWPNGTRIMNYADIVVRKEADGQWYIIPASIDEIANRYADSAEGIPPVPTDEWHTILAGRLDEFLTCWQKKDKDGLLALCTTPWRSEWDRLNQLLENRTPQSWEIEWVQESGLPVVTVGCSISMQSEEEDGFFRFTAKKGTDGVWYFEPHEMWDTKVSVASPYSITDRDLILTGNEKGFQAKAEEIPPFVNNITDFLTLWNQGNVKGMLALCQPSGRDERFANTVAAMATDGDKPIEWKIGQLYGAPEEDARGAACELTIRRRDGQEIVYPVDITAIKEATGTWYLSCRSVEQISSDMLSAQMKAAEEENNRKNNPDNEEIINTLNEFYSCWMNNDKEGMQARGVPGEDDRDYKSLMDTLLDLGLPQAFYPGEIRETGAENTRSLHGSASFRTPEGEDVAYYVDFVVEKADDGQWYIHPDVHLTLMNVVELQEATADGQETRKLAWPITVSMELSADRLAGPAPVNVDISVTNTSGRKLEESVRLFDQTMTQIEAFGASGLDAGETRTWSGEYTVTREQLAEGKVLFFLYFSEYNESTEEFEDHLVSFYRPITKEEPPMP